MVVPRTKCTLGLAEHVHKLRNQSVETLTAIQNVNKENIVFTDGIGVKVG